MTKAPLWILAAAFVGAPASAQFSQAELVRPAEAQDLNGHLARLAANPRDVNALIGAGEAALALDDPQAAAGFFARADAIESGNGRIKAGQGRVMLAMQNPAQALALFDQASRIGYDAANFASYRALARDLTGDQAGAQEDYRTALKAKPDDPELIRRYAASLGISGQVDAAEQVLKPLLYKSDRAAWRYRAFILAMNNRQDDARKIAEQTLPAQLATGLVPYLQKMPYLTGAQKAAAMHLGHFPARIGTQIAAITPTTAAPSANGAPTPAAKVAEAAPTPPETGPIRRAGVRRSSGDDSPRRVGDRRRKRDAQLAAAEMPVTPAPAPVEPEPVPPPPPAPQSAIPLPSAATAVVQPLPEKPASRAVATPEVRIAAQDAAPGLSAGTTPMPAPSAENPVEAKAESAKREVAAAPVVELPTSAPKPSTTTSAPGPAAVRAPSLAPAVEVAMAPRREAVQGPPAPAPQDVEAAPVTTPPASQHSPATAAPVTVGDAAPAAVAESTPAPDPEATRSLADIIRAIDVPDSELRNDVAPVDLAEIEKLQAARRAAQEAAAEKAKKAAAAKAKAEADAKAKAEAAEKKRLADNPSRNWVQVGIGQSRSALGFTMKKLRAKYSALAPQDAWAASWGRTNRLLVGPFASFARAKAVEEELKSKGADVFAWQSKAGEQVDRIGD